MADFPKYKYKYFLGCSLFNFLLFVEKVKAVRMFPVDLKLYFTGIAKVLSRALVCAVSRVWGSATC